MTERRIHPITLRFEDVRLETEFRDRYHEQSLQLMRWGLMMGFVIYGAFGLLDIVAVPTKLREIWLIRFGIASPITAALLVWSFRRSFRFISQIGIAVLAILCATAIVVMTMIAPPPANYLYQAGVMAVLMFASAVMRLRFIYVVATSLIVTVLYNVIALADGTTPAWIVINHNFFLLTVTVLGGFAAYGIEHYARRNFLANRDLVESRQLIIESSRRAQLIFSALAEALPGTTLDDKYEVGEKIGSGGFGTVYRGKHLLLEAEVAIKIFRPSNAKDLEKSFERFRLEGISAKRINHPNAVEVMDFGIASSAVAFLVMELLEGKTLADEIRDEWRLSPLRCAEIIVPICGVLAEAHRLGIIHRDIKPGNIFLHRSKQGEVVKVLDFGIAKVTEQSLTPMTDPLTATGAVIGTPSYMAPERVMGTSYGFSSDVYSVGVMMFQMLAGSLPPTATVAVLKQALHETPEPLADLIIRALAPQPEDRPTAYELATNVSAMFNVPLAMSTPGTQPDRGVLRSVTDAPTEVKTDPDHAPTEVRYVNPTTETHIGSGQHRRLHGPG